MAQLRAPSELTGVVYKKAFDTRRARRTRLRRIYPYQNHNNHHTPGIIVYINE